MFLNIVQSDVCNFAADNILHSFDKNLENAFSNVKYDFKNVPNWFQVNSLKANLSKFQVIILGIDRSLSFVLDIDGKKINISCEAELVGIVIDTQLKFKTHSKSSLNSQFNYAAFIWMFSGKTAVNKICKIHYRMLQVVYIVNIKNSMTSFFKFIKTFLFIKNI